MRLWVNSYAKSAVGIAAVSAVVSIFVHAGVIAAWIYATLPDPGVPPTSIADRVYYIPPPDRAPGQLPVREMVHYVALAREPTGVRDGPRMMRDARPVATDAHRALADSALTSPDTAPALAGTRDSVFSILEVDTAVVRSVNSAAPAYPLTLLEASVSGYVSAQYIVDTTGFADTASFVVVESTNPGFVAAVRDALPHMRFNPAKIGQSKVRQLVEQMFAFRIKDSTVVKADSAVVKAPNPTP